MAEGKILPYLDVPFQHASPRILKLMKRPASGEKNLERIRAWREICPELTIRSHLHRRLSGRDRARVRASCSSSSSEAELDRVGCFAYSPVEGAAANELPGAVPEEVQGRAPRALHGSCRKRSARGACARKVGTRADAC